MYGRYRVTIIDEYDDLGEAVSALQWGGEWGELWAYVIYDNHNETFYIPDDYSELLEINTNHHKTTLREKLGLPPEGPFVIAGHFDRHPPDI